MYSIIINAKSSGDVCVIIQMALWIGRTILHETTYCVDREVTMQERIVPRQWGGTSSVQETIKSKHCIVSALIASGLQSHNLVNQSQRKEIKNDVCQHTWIQEKLSRESSALLKWNIQSSTHPNSKQLWMSPIAIIQMSIDSVLLEIWTNVNHEILKIADASIALQ